MLIDSGFAEWGRRGGFLGLWFLCALEGVRGMVGALGGLVYF